MKKILWLSRHSPLPIEVVELKRVFGELEVCQDVNPFASADEIIERVRRGGYDDVVVVAPLSVIDRLCRLGMKPLWADMEQLSTAHGADFTYRGRHYRFVKFRRVVGVEVKYEDIE
ncbi:MAG TPA: hypothetical protein VJA28_01645 [Patescibacteria group bacterium]|nr:hypothetical protein [Patescibacteria group bacterium]